MQYYSYFLLLQENISILSHFGIILSKNFVMYSFYHVDHKEKKGASPGIFSPARSARVSEVCILWCKNLAYTRVIEINL